MSIFYLNHSTGDDANDGSSWALAWKTITSGATAAQLNPGDIIRIAKTSDPTLIGNAEWTNKSKTVTLAAACTANIDLCASTWTPVANVSCDTSTTRKEGSLSSRITIAAAFTDGKIAYKTIPSTDFSAYQQISFWIHTSVATTALKICLCSDTAGATIVDEFTLPALSTINKWYPITLNKGANLGAAIQSVALYAIVDPGTPVLTIDNIIACKATASADSLTLRSLISKNSAATGGIHSWHGIQSINDTTVLLDNGNMTLASDGRGYAGTSETVATYKRETVTISAQETVNKSGTEISPIDYQFGFNTSTNVQDGETFLDGLIGNFYGIYISSKDFIKMSNVSAVRCTYGIYSTTSKNLALIIGSLCNNTNYGITLSSSHGSSISIRDICNNVEYGLSLSTTNCSIIKVININNNLSQGLFFASSYGNRINCANAKNNSLYGVYFSGSYDNKLIIDTADNSSGGIYVASGRNYLNKSTISEAIEVAGIPAYSIDAIFSTLHDNTPSVNKVFIDGAIIRSQSAVRQTTSGVAWRISPTSTNRNSFYPVTLPIARVAVNSGGSVTVYAWFLRDSLDITGKMICRAGQIAGLTSDVVDTITVGIDTWEELSVSFSPAESGIVEIEAIVYGGTTNSVYVDSIRIS